ncbi:MAG: hypothetical protein OHK0039_05540 [Bacteroidia bacterium]
MPLDDLQTRWAATSEPLHHSRATLAAMLRPAVGRRLVRIRRHVGLELGLVLALGCCVGLLGWLRLLFPLPFTLFLLGLALAGIVLYGYKHWQLGHIPADGLDLRQTLQRSVGLLGEYLRLYRILLRVFLPLCIASGLVYGMYAGAAQQGLSLRDLPAGIWLGAGLIMAAGIVLGRRAGDWYLGRLYGDHYAALCTCLDELLHDETGDPSAESPG